jgi:hypothetical protein
MRQMYVVAFLGATIGLLGCSSDGNNTKTDPVDPSPDTTGNVTGAVTYHTHIKPILDMVCTRCHAEGQIREDTPLDTYAGAKPLAMLIKSQVTERIMPPWLAGHGCNDYFFDETLTEEEIALVSEWADNGAPEGDPAAEPYKVKQRFFAVLSREDLEIDMPLEYTPKLYPDEYRCFLIDWPETTKRYITGFGAKAGNHKVVHHIIAYLVPPAAVPAFQAFDDNDEGPGYSCFGGPSATTAGAELVGGGFMEGVRFLGGWAPGGIGGDFPPGTGFPVEVGSKIALQVHYNTLINDPEPDRSSVVFKVDDTVDNESYILPWTNFQWLVGGGMNIPAGEADVVHSWSGSPWLAPWITSDKLRVHSVTLHMHELGASGSVFLKRKDGSTECLLEIPRWDFGWQRNYGLMEPVDLEPGDELGLECHWDNTVENQQLVDGELLPPRNVTWGEGTTDEMCIAFFYVVPMNDESGGEN